MTPNDVSNDPAFRAVTQKLLSFATTYGPTPQRQAPLHLSDIERHRDALRQKMAASPDEAAADLEGYRNLLDAMGIEQDVFEAAMAGIAEDLQQLVERHPDLRDMSVTARSQYFEAQLRDQDWSVDAVAEVIGLTGDALRKSIKVDEDDGDADAGGGGLRDSRRAKALCEAGCHVTFALALLGLLAAVTAQMVGCQFLIIPILVLICGAIAIAEMIIAMMAAQRAYDRCLEAC